MYVIKTFQMSEPKKSLTHLSSLSRGQGQLDPLPTKAAGYQSNHGCFESTLRALDNICSFV